jgi:hypothetical protein
MGDLKVIDITKESFPAWDYQHTHITKHNPIVMYCIPNSKFQCVYTVKIYWKTAAYKNGVGIIMDDKDLPHQGHCLRLFNITNGRIEKGLNPNELRILNNVSLS